MVQSKGKKTAVLRATQDQTTDTTDAGPSSTAAPPRTVDASSRLFESGDPAPSEELAEGQRGSSEDNESSETVQLYIEELQEHRDCLKAKYKMQ